MKGRNALAVALAAPLALATAGLAQSSKPVSVHEEMIKVVIPKAQVIWDMSNETMDDDGVPSAELMTAERWASVEKAAADLSASMIRLESAEHLLAAGPGQKIMNEEFEGAAKASDVQRLIDADPEGIRKYAREMDEFVAEIAAAVEQRDFDAFYEKSLELDGACEGCHKAYWTAAEAQN